MCSYIKFVGIQTPGPAGDLVVSVEWEDTLIEIKILDEANLESLHPFADEFVIANKGFSFRQNYKNAFNNWIRKIANNPDIAIFIAKNGTEIVGMAVGRIDENGPLLLPERIGYLGMLVVLSKWRRKGVGKKLWEKMKEWFLYKEIKEVQLYTDNSNEEARIFWKQYGFDVLMERRRCLIGTK